MSLEERKARLMKELRVEGIEDSEVLRAIECTPREEFVLPSFRDQAYDNNALPIAQGQTISQPLVVGIMTQALALDKTMRVLEVGTGSGYQAAVLSRLCRHVYSMERHQPLLEEAQKVFDHLGYENITAVVGDGTKGWPEEAPFDRIIVTAAASGVPEALLEQLKVGGILVIPDNLPNDPFSQWILRIHKAERGTKVKKILPVRFVPLVKGLPANGK